METGWTTWRWRARVTGRASTIGRRGRWTCGRGTGAGSRRVAELRQGGRGGGGRGGGRSGGGAEPAADEFPSYGRSGGCGGAGGGAAGPARVMAGERAEELPAIPGEAA